MFLVPWAVWHCLPPAPSGPVKRLWDAWFLNEELEGLRELGSPHLTLTWQLAARRRAHQFAGPTAPPATVSRAESVHEGGWKYTTWAGEASPRPQTAPPKHL